jgi:hypothetical protein
MDAQSFDTMSSLASAHQPVVRNSNADPEMLSRELRPAVADHFLMQSAN